MFAIPNLVSTAAYPCKPWEFTVAAPEEVRADKTARDRWINDPKTLHEVYSPFEGVISNLRVKKPEPNDEGNPPLQMHGFVVDVDEKLSDDALQLGLSRMGDNLPQYFGRSLSGKVHLIWLFERPVRFPSYKFAEEWLALAWKKMRFAVLSPETDEPAFNNPNRYYTNGGEWYDVMPERRLPAQLLHGWTLEVAEKHRWRKDRGAVEIPMPAVVAEMAKKFPQFPGCWPGDFEVGSQGPSFWVEGSTSPKSAIVKPTGLFTFSAHAIKPFYSWADLLGAQFVETYRSEMMGRAVEGIFHDGTKYYRKDGYGDWKWYAKEDIVSHLNVDRGLSTSKDGDGTPSEVARAIQYIQNWQGVVGAAPFVFQPTGIIVKNGNRFLNTHTRRALLPAEGPAVWGESGKFPFLSQYLGGFFEPVEQLEVFLSWLARFYQGAYGLQLESGQNVFILGKQDVGKTLLSQGVLPRLVGGSMDAEDYLLGKTNFNSDLFEVGLWTVDDNSANVDVSTHRKFSAMVKKMAANTTFSYHAKFRIPCSVEWLGRVLITANDDEESARIVPDLSISILDKLHLFRAAPKPAVTFPSRYEMLSILDAELPHFARFLLDYSTPAHLVGSARYGVKAYHEPSLLRTAEQSSRTAGFVEILDDWASAYFANNLTAKFWEGTAYQFLKSLHKESLASEGTLRQLTAGSVGTMLSSVKAKGIYNLEVISNAHTRVWRIYRPEEEPKIAPLPTGTSFKK